MKILLISYHFPPDTAVGGLRIARFAKYLPTFAWTPYVLTVKDHYRYQMDVERANDVKNIKIFKTIELPKARQYYVYCKKLLSNLLQKKCLNAEEMGKSFVENETGISQLEEEGIRKRIKRYYNSLFLSLPDDKLNWIIPAVIRAIFEIKSQKIDYIMTSSPPHSVDLIGLLVKKITNVKWIADLRDPWIDVLSMKPSNFRCTLSDNIERWMEKHMILNADRIVTNTKHFKDALKRRYKLVPEKKFLYIPNGIDEEKFNYKNETTKYETFTITYTGSLYAGRSPEPVFEAIKGLVYDRKIDLSDIEVKLIGYCQFIDGKPTSKVVQSYGLDKVIKVSEQVSYKDALFIMRRSHLLLLLAPPLHYLMLPAKVYDYIGSGTKILAVTGNGATSEIIKTTSTGESFFPSDIQGIREYIYKLYKQMKNGNNSMLANDAQCYSQFDVKLLTQQLSEELSLI